MPALRARPERCCPMLLLLLLLLMLLLMLLLLLLTIWSLYEIMYQAHMNACRFQPDSGCVRSQPHHASIKRKHYSGRKCVQAKQVQWTLRQFWPPSSGSGHSGSSRPA